jgi:hypothetical protein
MKVLELVGTRVWIRCDQFRKVSGVIARVLKPVSRDDLQSSIAESLFDVALSTGKVVRLLGAQICKVDHNASARDTATLYTPELPVRISNYTDN